MQHHHCWLRRCGVPLLRASASEVACRQSASNGIHLGRAGNRSSSLLVRARGAAAMRELEELQKNTVKDTTPVIKRLEWKSPMEIVLYPDPRLRAQNARIGVFDESLRRLAEEMFDVMYKANDGVGLAAPQVGVNVRLMVFNPTGVKGEPDYVLVNPKIVHSSKKKDIEEEGCLSFPKIYGDVERSMQIKIKAQDLSGKQINVSMEGWQARIFQHEYDHLEGALFHDRMSPRELGKVKPQLRAMEDKFKAKQPDVAFRSVT